MLDLTLPDIAPKVLVFCDFDGTVTTTDTGTIIIDKCLGYERRKELDQQILDGSASFRSAVATMWDSVKIPWEDALILLKDVELDPCFVKFHQFCIEHQLPLVVLSSGLAPLVNMFLRESLSDSHARGHSMQILANDVSLTSQNAENKWQILYRDDTAHGHDKSLAIRFAKSFYTNKDGVAPLIVFVGDGVSDISAAEAADIVFAKRGKDLETWCLREKVRYTPWDDFGTILGSVQERVLLPLAT
ncbi:HAD-like domain-containing protein [Phlyctochytrium arcticum]|nr:HAD-like domain-containing protein [Phlyctochytrium arcticum]